MLFTETMTIGEKLLNSIAISILGMAVVFVVLIIIAYSLELLRIMFKEKDTKEESTSVNLTEMVSLVPATQENIEDIDLLLIITAAIAAEENSSTDDFYVRSIKPSVQKDTLWASAGRHQNMNKKM